MQATQVICLCLRCLSDTRAQARPLSGLLDNLCYLRQRLKCLNMSLDPLMHACKGDGTFWGTCVQ